MISKEQIRSDFIKRDNGTLEDRVERWSQMKPAAYCEALPALVWDYLIEVDEMYIRGHFIATIILCATTLEIVIAHRLKSLKDSPWKPKQDFKQMIDLAHEYQEINSDETASLHDLRELRNVLVHGSVNKLDKMTKIKYEMTGVDEENSRVLLYIHSISNHGIDKNAFECVELTRDLTLKFYGEHLGR